MYIYHHNSKGIGANCQQYGQAELQAISLKSTTRVQFWLQADRPLMTCTTRVAGNWKSASAIPGRLHFFVQFKFGDLKIVSCLCLYCYVLCTRFRLNLGIEHK